MKMNATIAQEQILDLIDLTRGKTIRETGGLLSCVELENEILYIKIIVDKSKTKECADFKNAMVRFVKLNLGFPGIRLDLVDEQDENNRKKNKGKNFIFIGSGKGGVGKSTVTANLAYAFSRLGHKVGIIDADIYGASLPYLMNMTDCNVEGTEDGKMFPLDKDGIEFISTEYFAKGEALMWRGPMLGKMLQAFVNDVLWSDKIEYMFVDLPPGTGDVCIDMNHLVPEANMIIVTTPHMSAGAVAKKAGFGAKQMNQHILGVIENMSYYINPVNQEKEYIFGYGGGEDVACDLHVSHIGSIPIGQPNEAGSSIFSSNEEIGQIYEKIAKRVIELSK